MIPQAAATPRLETVVKIVLALALIITVLQQVPTVLCQVLDGDESFQAYHQDIGRISSPSVSSPVAPQSIVRQLSLVTASNAPLSQGGQEAGRVRPSTAAGTRSSATQSHQQHHQHNHYHQQQQQQQQQQPSTRRPGRVTLAVRTHAPVTVSVIGEPAAISPTPIAAAIVQAEQPPAPATFTTSSSQLFAPQQTQFVAALASNPQQQQQAAAAGPALTSFRSGLSNSVSARHSALMAQVASERQAAAAAASTNPQDFSPSARGGGGGGGATTASLGSPLEALSQPSVLQVQPPPALHNNNNNHHHHHQNTQQQRHHQQPAAAASSAALSSSGFVDQPEEPLVAPSFEHVLSQGCPRKGVFSYENKDHCDRYYMCTNGTFTEEACPNGLAYSQMGAVYQHCAYNWNVDCGTKKTSEPLASPGCPWQFGIFPVSSAGRCSIDYFVCEWGVPETKRCQPEGLFYDDRIKGCQWADQLGCKSEGLLNFKCPSEDEDNPYWPYPRYYHTKQDIIVCVNEQPRLVHCTEEQIVDPSSLACMDLKKKKKQRIQ